MIYLILICLLLADFTLSLKPLHPSGNVDNKSKDKNLLKSLTEKIGGRRYGALRAEEEDEEAETALPDPKEIIEKELVDAQVKNSALYDKPFVEHIGKKDFLVLGPTYSDAFVTIVPNDIYYNVEKKCVNWLDDCSSNGIRMRLLQRIRGPN